jgi:hypothetical protein
MDNDGVRSSGVSILIEPVVVGSGECCPCSYERVGNSAWMIVGGKASGVCRLSRG